MTHSNTSGLTRRTLFAGGGVLAAGAAGGWWISQRYTPPHDNTRLTVAEAFDQAASGQVLLVDIRTPAEWRRTGLPQGAVPLDMRRPDFTTELLRLTGGVADAPVALICAGGVRSARLSLRLTEAGFTQIIDVPEGMFGSAAGPGWLNSKLPVTNWQG
ncbi:molybdopterin biosynthesis protein MoeB [Tritonibacter multivorans]|uniref:Molybdopterin biosynthesis protein MoeB n=1 Tax=Tritonibacter multivorans TaxID=928856 RepID=A0A0P1GHE6_9RHOB|nr:rhodanese-like domain-containing protein [Tritonibacter multivorans]MDA7420569.1 rhodanese-like domain-containing protein [Tritonibacter multivorans]CUH81356.1 molybdopterin biosynthesis protein MoeB [Tritonibacter multivorans]SFC33615.1 Rhodanese-related sulfurtransferase [Tritonibacter multivorans]